MQLSLLVLRARQPELLSKFYEQFGCSFELEKHGDGPVHYACSHESTVFEIYPLSAGQTSTSAVRVGFQVPDLESACQYAVALGGQLLSKPKSTDFGRHAVMRDPEGHTVELMEASP